MSSTFNLAAEKTEKGEKMNSSRLATILRCLGLALIVLGVFVLVPAAAQAQPACTPGNHGVSIFKSCVSPKNKCATDADCADTDQCNGIEQCATEEAAGSNVVECTISLGNPTTHCDNITLTEAADTITNATGPGLSSSTIQIVGTSTGVVSGTCTAGTDLGGAVTCTIAPGGMVSFLANYYTVVATDPSPLSDQATITVADTCSASPSGCSTTPNNVQFTASTTTVSGCSAGSPLTCNDNSQCTTDTCDPASGCVFTAITCNDNSQCTTDSCDPATGCVFSPITCNDNSQCTTDSCDPATGCVFTPITCDDNDACTTDTCEAGSGCVFTPDPSLPGCTAPAGGRMTGGGSIFTKAGGRVTHGFELHCDPEVGPNNLEINWGGGNHFHLEVLDTAVCTDDPAIAPRPPSADFDTYNGTGTGSCNGVEGASITFVLTDAGEPGKKDFASFEITGCPGGLTLSVDGNLNKGNQQAHKN
jgi:slime mold repeat-containing protein